MVLQAQSTSRVYVYSHERALLLEDFSIDSLMINVALPIYGDFGTPSI